MKTFFCLLALLAPVAAQEAGPCACGGCEKNTEHLAVARTCHLCKLNRQDGDFCCPVCAREQRLCNHCGKALPAGPAHVAYIGTAVTVDKQPDKSKTYKVVEDEGGASEGVWHDPAKPPDGASGKTRSFIRALKGEVHPTLVRILPLLDKTKDLVVKGTVTVAGEKKAPKVGIVLVQRGRALSGVACVKDASKEFELRLPAPDEEGVAMAVYAWNDANGDGVADERERAMAVFTWTDNRWEDADGKQAGKPELKLEVK